MSPTAAPISHIEGGAQLTPVLMASARTQLSGPAWLDPPFALPVDEPSRTRYTTRARRVRPPMVGNPLTLGEPVARLRPAKTSGEQTIHTPHSVVWIRDIDVLGIRGHKEVQVLAR